MNLLLIEITNLFHINEWLLLQKLKVTYIGVELIELKSGDLRWCLDFRDMGSPAIILLSDAYGKKSDSGGFVLCPLYGRKSKAFQAASGTTSSAIISSLVRMALLGIMLLQFYSRTYFTSIIMLFIYLCRQKQQNPWLGCH